MSSDRRTGVRPSFNARRGQTNSRNGHLDQLRTGTGSVNVTWFAETFVAFVQVSAVDAPVLALI